MIIAFSFFDKIIKQKVVIAYGLNNKYTFPTLVSITSIMENGYSNTYYIFYLLVNKKNFKKENRQILINLEKKYEKCEVNIIGISNKNLIKANTKRYPLSAYYRLYLAELIPDLNRIIYLDGDTLIYTDLSEMYNLYMGNNIILGFVDNSYKKAIKFGVKTYKYIVSGVLLINLKKMRKEKITQKFTDFIEKFQIKLTQEDQTVINVVLHGRIDFLPPKFGIWNFRNNKSVLYHNYYRKENLGIKAYDEKEILKAWNSPSILHYVKAKPWSKNSKIEYLKFNNDWWKYARMTDEYNNIISFYKRHIYSFYY